MATAARETAGLIGSDNMAGTTVYDGKGEQMGAIERVLIGKHTGQVAYAVLRCGGFLGLGTDSYPLPWATRSYDTTLGGYRTTIAAEQLRGAPKYAGNAWDWAERERGRQIHADCGTPWRDY